MALRALSSQTPHSIEQEEQAYGRAPEGKVWQCECGRRAANLYGGPRTDPGWDAACALRCEAVDEDSPRPLLRPAP